MPDLTSEQKRFIVEALACYDTPTMLKTDLKARFGIDVDLQQISYYNPENKQGGKELAEEWKTLHKQRREEFLSNVEAIPIANTAFRLRRLQRIVDSAKADNMPIIVKDVLKQVAMEMGGMFTNKREISGPGGKPIEVNNAACQQASQELDEWRKTQAAGLAALLSEPPP